MRLIVDSLIALMLVGILGTLLWHHRGQQRELERYQFMHQALARLHDQATYHRALGDVECAQEGFPLRIAPGWFGDEMPVNILVSTQRPWLDVAPPGDEHDHPPDPVIEHDDQAGFWYNPTRGVFRARVAPQLTDQQTLALYNRVNGTALLSLPESDEHHRAPQPHHPLARVAAAEPAAQQDGAPDAASAPKRRPTLLTRPDATAAVEVDLP